MVEKYNFELKASLSLDVSHRLEPDVILEVSYGLTDAVFLFCQLVAIPGYRDYNARHMFLAVGVTGTHDQLDGVVRIGKNIEMNVGRLAERTSALVHIGERAELDGLDRAFCDRAFHFSFLFLSLRKMIQFFTIWLERHIVKNRLVKRKSVNFFFLHIQ